MPPQGTTSVACWQRAVTVITITFGVMATALVAVPIVNVPIAKVPMAKAPSLAGASSTGHLVSAPASGRAPIRRASAALVRGGPDQPSPRPDPRLGAVLVPGAGKPLPRSWPHSAAMAHADGRLPPSVVGSLPSANWAGYEDSGAGAQFTEVTASWVVPTVDDNTYGDSSTWIGIDGITSHDDLVQAGTDQSWSASGAVYYAWYELLPEASVELGVVSPGDHITAKIDQTRPGTWAISVDDLTQHVDWAQSVAYSAPGTTAEWVEEAPTLSFNNSIETLADFGMVDFTDMAVEGPGTAAATSSPIYMIIHSTHIIAYPTQYDPSTDSFSVVYGTLKSPPASQMGVTIGPPTSSATTTTTTTAPPGQLAAQGLWLAARNGGIFAFGTAQFRGSTGTVPLQRPITGMAPTADHGGYWMVASDGGVFTFGDAAYVGSVPASGIGPVGSKMAHHLLAPIVGIVPTPDGKGYLMVASDGGVFAFGDAHFVGSCASIGGCPAPVVAVVPDATGRGYWLLLSNCEMVAFGDAPKIPDVDCQNFAHAHKVVATAAARTPGGNGYWVLLANGALYAEGSARSLGSSATARGAAASDPAVAVVPTSDGRGAWVVDANGTVEAFGDAPNLGGGAGKPLSAPIIAAAGW